MSSIPNKILRQCAAGVVLGAWVLTGVLSTALSQQHPGEVDFRRDVQPLLKQYCIECHGPSQQMHGYRLDVRRNAMRGSTGRLVTPGNGATSRLYLKLIGKQYGPQMPPTGALSQEQSSIIKAWIDQGAQWPDDLSGETPLAPADAKATRIMAALRDGDKQSFKKLASEDAKVGNLRGAGGTTPLMQAALYGDVESVRLLLEGGADPNIRNDAGATALMWGVGDLEKARLLLDHGADVNARSEDERTPLLIAAGQFGSSPVVKLLLDRGANVAVKSPYALGYWTPLSEAARAGDDASLRLLIGHGADAKSGGFEALANAYRANCAICLETLIEGADRGTLTRAALLLAPPRGDARGSGMLVDRGADPNARNPRGYTILMLAASSDAIPAETVKTLITRGAEVNAKSPEGKTALDFAKQRGSTAVVDLLIKAGAKEGAAPATVAWNPKPAHVIRAAIERSIPLLQRTDSIFTQKAGCVSCHNNSLTAMAVATARQSGLPVDEQIARNQLKTTASHIETLRERALQDTGIPGESSAPGYIMLGLAAENYPPDPATDALARFVRSRQLPDGRWVTVSHRPPIESNDIQVTAAALRSLQVYGPKAERAKYEVAIKGAAEWLMKAQPQTTEERAFQLLGLGWAGVKVNDPIIKKDVRGLLAEQRSDGGWAQLPSLSSDAYATGQALVALKQAGGLSVTSAEYERGVEFLLKTQFEDGSWYVKSRSMPIQPYFESGFPYGEDQWISVAATNWATMALALTVRPQSNKPR